MPGRGAEDKERKKKEKRPVSRCSSRSNSRRGTPIASPNKYVTLELEDDEETDAWTC